MDENDRQVVRLVHFYHQFNGDFFFWPYVSLRKEYFPKIFRFIYGSEIIDAYTEAVYYNSCKDGDAGIDSICGSRIAEILIQAFSASGVHWETIWPVIEHINRNYRTDETMPLFDASPKHERLSNEAEEEIILDDWCLKLLLLRRIQKN